jgi:valyl-tRNA synthetase
MTELAKQYDPATVEPDVTARWLDRKAFSATPDERENRYVVMMPLPNVTGALHMGHAMDNVMQDLLTRWHRMQGDNTLWMAGTDHAGIATQSVVEKRLFELEGKTRHDIGREALVERIFQWKDQYQQRIVRQQQAMGCGCDWDRQRFTMDEVCARAVRHTFFALFRDGLIYQGDRLVNWDCHLQTAVADDELYKQTVDGHFWHLRYPVIDPKPDEPTFIVVATTRPETMLGDTAVACHPDPRGQLEALIKRTEERLAAAPQRERADIEAELERLRERRQTHVPLLETIARMAREGRQLMLPLQQRPIPLILDEWPKPELGSGCVKITPGHDPNDYEVWQRHRERIEIRNILSPDGTLSTAAGEGYAGLDRFDARKKVVAELEALGLLESVEERSIEIDHSDRSKTIIEPYLSKQWFVRMGDVEGGIVCGRGTQQGVPHSGSRAGGDRRDLGRVAVADGTLGALLAGPGPLPQDLPRVARREARLVHQQAALVGPPDPRLVR